MNPALIAQLAAPLLQDLLASGKLDGLLPGDLGDKIKSFLPGGHGTPAPTAKDNVTAALTMLADAMPTDPTRALAFADALNLILRNVAALRATMEPKATV